MLKNWNQLVFISKGKTKAEVKTETESRTESRSETRKRFVVSHWKTAGNPTFAVSCHKHRWMSIWQHSYDEHPSSVIRQVKVKGRNEWYIPVLSGAHGVIQQTIT